VLVVPVVVVKDIPLFVDIPLVVWHPNFIGMPNNKNKSKIGAILDLRRILFSVLEKILKLNLYNK
jgi:hypothetical protein